MGLQAASIVLNVFLLGSVSETAWARFGIWIAATLVVFFLYSLPSSYTHSRSRYASLSWLSHIDTNQGETCTRVMVVSLEARGDDAHDEGQ